jgi:hypothetical protein
MPKFFITYRFSFDEVCPDPEEIFEYLRLTDESDEHPSKLFVREILPTFRESREITGGYKIVEVSPLTVKEGMIRVGDSVLHTGTQVSGYMKKAERLALFLCTAGESFTTLTAELNRKGDIMEAYIVDAIGSLVVEKAMDRIQESLEKTMFGKGLGIGNRYSPGYCNWPLSDQKMLFELIGPNPVNISLSESCLMQPIKSVSGIIGIGKEVTKKAYGCKTCNNASCIYRNITKNKSLTYG